MLPAVCAASINGAIVECYHLSFQNGIVIWNPNNSFWNRMRLRFGMSIDPSRAVEVAESLIASTPEKCNELKREICQKATEERVKLMYDSIRMLVEKTSEL